MYDKVEGKVVINKKDPTSGHTQVALLSETKQGRLTLDCKILYTTSTMPSPHHAEAFIGSLYMDPLLRRDGHSGEAALHRLLQNDMATGIGQVFASVSPCDPRPPHLAVTLTHDTTYDMELAVMDLADPVTPSSLGGASYFLELKGVAKGQSKAKLLILCKDNGGEFTSVALIV